MESIKSSKFVSHWAKISGEFDPWKDLQAATLERKPCVLVELRFRELRNSKLPVLRSLGYSYFIDLINEVKLEM